MRKFTLIAAALTATLISNAQTPVSHLPGVTVTASGNYAPASNAKDFSLCNFWNAGTYNGWLIINLGAPTDINEITWWNQMNPNGSVTTELVQVSQDGVSWTTVMNNSGLYHFNGQEWHIEFPVPYEDMQYIRITRSGSPSWFAIREFVVNDPYYLSNMYVGMKPKVLNAAGRPAEIDTTSLPQTIYCSKASTYQWKKDGVNIAGATNQSLEVTEPGAYTCAVTYPFTCAGVVTESDAAPLPLTLLRFDAVLGKGAVSLVWETADEVNLSHFEIERSEDVRHFSTIATVAATNAQHANYNVVDKYLPDAHNVYYRLKQVNADGTITYSTVKKVKLYQEQKGYLYPNPAQDKVTVKYDKEFPVTHTDVSDVTGRSMGIFTLSKDNTIDISTWSPGIYYVRLYNGSQFISVQKLVVR